MRCGRPLKLFLNCRHIKACALLHRWKLKESLCRLCHLLLHEHEAPELKCKPVVVGYRAVILAVVHSRPFVGVQTEIDEDRPIDLLSGAKPAVGLVGKAVLIVIDAHGPKGSLGEIENLVSLRRTLAGDHVHLVVAVEVHFVSAGAEFLALPEVGGYVTLITGYGYESRKPVEPGNDPVLDLATWHLTRPSNDCGYAKASFERSAFTACERSLAAIGPSKVFGSIVGAKRDERVIIEPVVLHVLHHRADDIVELRHPGFLDGPAVFRGAHRFILIR